MEIDYNALYGVEFDNDAWGNHPPVFYLNIDVARKMIVDGEMKFGLLTKCSIELFNNTALDYFGLSYISSLPDVCRNYRIPGGENGLQFERIEGSRWNK